MADTMIRPNAAGTGPTPRPGVMDIRPYKPGDSQIAGADTVVKLSSNENALGASPAGRAAAEAACARLDLYPDGGATLLREAAAAAYGLDPERVICGAGSDEILQLVARAYAGPGDEILFSEHGFLVYRLAALQVGARPVAAPETDLKADVDALLAHVTARTRIVYLANPNNPTGSYLSREEAARLHAGLPETTLLVVDGAYAEFLTACDYEDGLGLARTAPNVLATRTFSKIYGLAGLRIGWGYASADIIGALHRMRGPFNVAKPAIAAGAAAMGDAAFVEASRAHNTRELAYLHEQARRLGLLARDSVGNFVLLRFPNEAGRTVDDADAHLRARGFLLRGVAPYGLHDCLRMTIGSQEHNRAVIAALDELMAGA